MPYVTVALKKGTTNDFRRAVSNSIHRAMVEVLGIPEDDHFHVFNELDDGNMIYEPVSFGVERGDRMMFIWMYINERTKGVKGCLFAAIGERLAADPGVDSSEWGIVVIETGRDNWWAYGRVVNTATGYDERMDIDDGGAAAP